MQETGCSKQVVAWHSGHAREFCISAFRLATIPPHGNVRTRNAGESMTTRAAPSGMLTSRGVLRRDERRLGVTNGCRTRESS